MDGETAIVDTATYASNLVHAQPIIIESVDIDFMGHVNNAVFLKWVQAAVLAHWERFAPPAAVAAYLWVAIKHEITYRRPALLGDTLVAMVTLQRFQRESAYYETVFRRGDEILVECQSRWCCLDAETRQPARLPAATVNCFFGERPGVLAE